MLHLDRSRAIEGRRSWLPCCRSLSGITAMEAHERKIARTWCCISPPPRIVLWSGDVKGSCSIQVASNTFSLHGLTQVSSSLKKKKLHAQTHMWFVAFTAPAQQLLQAVVEDLARRESCTLPRCPFLRSSACPSSESDVSRAGRMFICCCRRRLDGDCWFLKTVRFFLELCVCVFVRERERVRILHWSRLLLPIYWMHPGVPSNFTPGDSVDR